MGEKTPILKGEKKKGRILRADEYDVLKRGAKNIENQTNLDACLLLGARYEECRDIQKHPEWFDGDFINLPSEAQHKVKRIQKERWIRLSSIGKTIIPYFLKNKRRLPSVQSWDENLIRWAKRAGLNPVGLSARSLRKTYESWLVFYYPQVVSMIFLSQGHQTLTALEHYINLPFTEEDKKNIKKWVDGWI